MALVILVRRGEEDVNVRQYLARLRTGGKLNGLFLLGRCLLGRLSLALALERENRKEADQEHEQGGAAS